MKLLVLLFMMPLLLLGQEKERTLWSANFLNFGTQMAKTDGESEAIETLREGTDSHIKDYDEFLRGTWVSNLKDLTSVRFMENNLIHIIARKDKQKYGTNMHYRVVEDNAKEKQVKIILLQRDLLKEKFIERGELNISLKSKDTLIFYSKNFGDVILKRQYSRIDFR